MTSLPKLPTLDDASKSGELKGKLTATQLVAFRSLTASRNHRERKENYIKSLERAVLRLREEEAEVVQNSKVVQEENAMLREILSQHSIPIPDRTAVLKYVATVSVRDITDGGQCLQVTMPEMTDYSHAPFDSFTPPFSTSMETSSPESGNTAAPQVREISAQPSERGSPNEPRKGPAVANSGSLDNPQIGIDFVLSLEQPCLGHTRGEGGIYNEVPSGHALTAQAPLLTSAPRTLTPSSSWQIPAIEIDRLLDLSSQLNLLGEVTPVQAWARLTAHPRFVKLGRDNLESLKQALMVEVHCYGYVEQY
jgi:hypothetical protein